MTVLQPQIASKHTCVMRVTPFTSHRAESGGALCQAGVPDGTFTKSDNEPTESDWKGQLLRMEG